MAHINQNSEPGSPKNVLRVDVAVDNNVSRHIFTGLSRNGSRWALNLVGEAVAIDI